MIRISVGSESGPKVTEVALGECAGFGRRALASAMACDEVPPACHATGPENKPAVAPGLMAVTAVSPSDRPSFGCKSPVAGGIKEANSGGQAAHCPGRPEIAACALKGERTGSELCRITVNTVGATVDAHNGLAMLTDHALDSAGLCLSAPFAILDRQEAFDDMVETVNAMDGLSLTVGNGVEPGETIQRMERGFNAAAGFAKEPDRLPMRFSREALKPHTTAFDVPDGERAQSKAF